MADYLKTEALKDIAEAFESTTKVLVNHSKRLDIVERNIDDLYEIASRSIKVAGKRHNKRVLIVAVGVGMYVGYKIAEKNLDERKQQWEQVLREKQPAQTKPAEKSENGTDAPQS